MTVDFFLAFCALDNKSKGVVDALQLSSKYDPSRHPDVIAGIKKPDQVQMKNSCLDNTNRNYFFCNRY